MRNAKLDESQAGIKVARRNMNNLRYAEEAVMMAEVEEEVKSFLMRVKKESEKAGLKFNIQKKKKFNIQNTSRPITSWQVDGEKVEEVTDLIFLGSEITVVGDCSHTSKRRMLLGRKSLTKITVY